MVQEDEEAEEGGLSTTDLRVTVVTPEVMDRLIAANPHLKVYGAAPTVRQRAVATRRRQAYGRVTKP